MNNPKKKKIIILGGTGETGRRVIFHLCHTLPNVTIGCASRTPQQNNIFPSANVTAVKLDIYNKKQAITTLAKYDLAIITLGPMEQIGNLPHQICLEAGIDCIDINDNLQAADQIQSLHTQAKKQQNSIFTGMGFTPGLSTLLLAKLADNNISETGSYHVRAYMGAAYGGGKTSPYAMISSFSNQIVTINHGQRTLIKTPWKDKYSQFIFPAQSAAKDLIPFSALECAGLATEYSPLCHKIKNLDSRYHIQYLNQGFARFLANLSIGDRARNYLAKMFYRSGQKIKVKGKADPDTSLWVYPDNSPEKGVLIHGVISSYDLTALMVCSVTDCLLAGHMTEYKGVFATEQLQAKDRQKIETALGKRGITCRPADLPALHADGIYFGWVEPVCGKVNHLHNFNRNWYTQKRPHPKMIPLQKQFLLNSIIWNTLKKQSLPKFVGFIIRTLLRWRKHRQQFKHYQSRSSAELCAIWKHITQDISMFTSGYSCCRDILGQETAFRLYREMFLETGKMEMRCLWPEPEIFSAFSCPANAVREYWLAFMRNYAALEIMNFHIETVNKNQTICKIRECAYSKMFSEQGCPELQNLIREMEHEALMHLTKNTDLSVEWKQLKNGSATITLTHEAYQNARKSIYKCEEIST